MSAKLMASLNLPGKGYRNDITFLIFLRMPPVAVGATLVSTLDEHINGSHRRHEHFLTKALVHAIHNLVHGLNRVQLRFWVSKCFVEFLCGLALEEVLVLGVQLVTL